MLSRTHAEYAQNSISRPAVTVTQPHIADELRIGIRVSLQRYAGH